jgi:hypothetical protein
MKLALLLVLLSVTASAEKCRLADTAMSHASMWTGWYGCDNVTSAAHVLADGTQVDTLIVQHRTWWGKRWKVSIVPVEPVVKYDRDNDPSGDYQRAHFSLDRAFWRKYKGARG